jgi:ribosome recycling factor
LIRLPIPELSGDRRKELAKIANGMAEHGKVGIRAARKDSLDRLKSAQKEGDLSEDDFKRYEKEIQKITDGFSDEIISFLASKEKELNAL